MRTLPPAEAGPTKIQRYDICVTRCDGYKSHIKNHAHALPSIEFCILCVTGLVLPTVLNRRPASLECFAASIIHIDAVKTKIQHYKNNRKRKAIQIQIQLHTSESYQTHGT